MTSSERVTDLGEVGDLAAPPGSRPWAIATRLRIQAHLHTTNSNAEHLRAHLRAMREYQGWRNLTDARGRPFVTYEAFCCCQEPFGLGYDASALDQIIRERATAQAQAFKATKLSKHGEIGRNHVRVDIVRSEGSGNRADYLTARIARDRPDILKRMQRGEFKSVHQAAVAAGIRKVTVTVPLEPEAIARVLTRRLERAALAELVALLEEAL